MLFHEWMGPLMGNKKIDVEGDIMPTFSMSVTSFQSQAWCLSSNVYGFQSRGSVLSLSIRVIFTKSVLSVSGQCSGKMSMHL